MTRKEARMIAEEMVPLMRKEIKQIVAEVLQKEDKKDDVFLDYEGASKLTSLSVQYLRSHILDLPHRVIGKKRVFSRNALIEYMNR